MINKVLKIDLSHKEENDFFSLWIEYLTPKHHLTKSEQTFLAACLRQRYELSKSISDETLLDETTLNDTYKTKIRQSLGMSAQQMNNIIAKLKKIHILIPRSLPFSERHSYYKINPQFIPNYKEGEDFTLVLLFTHGERDT